MSHRAVDLVLFSVDFELLRRKLTRLKILNFGSISLCHRIWLWLFALVTIAGASNVLAEAPFQYHFVGGSQLSSDRHLVTLQKGLALPATTNLQSFARIRFCQWLTNSLRLGYNPSNTSLIEPLLADVVDMESLGSFGAPSVNGPNFILALHLPAQRAQLWQDTASKIFGGNGEKFKCQEFSGRRWNVGGSNLLWIIPARDWLLVGCGNDFSALQMEYLKQIKTNGRPIPALDHYWLEAGINSAMLGGIFQYLKPASIKITIASNGDNLQIEAKVLETEAILWKSDPWQIPKDLMRGQVISFTAGENVAASLNVAPTFSHFAGNPMTN